MKLTGLVLASLIGLGGVASADPGHPRLRQLLMQRFDRNHDGVLDGRERHQAARALRRLARRLERRQNVEQKLIRRYDVNGDGDVGPGEMPPAMARKLRRFDANGDGWLEPDELPR